MFSLFSKFSHIIYLSISLFFFFSQKLKNKIFKKNIIIIKKKKKKLNDVDKNITNRMEDILKKLLTKLNK